MKKIKVLITPSGTSTAVEIYKSLHECREIELFAADTDCINIGFQLIKNNWVCPNLTDDNYFNELEKYLLKNEIDLVFLTHDNFIEPFSKKQLLGNTKFIVPLIKTSHIISSKKLQYEYFQKIIKTPKVYSTTPINFPVFIKPNEGRGSIGAYKINNEKEYFFFKDYISDPIVIEYLPGKEYTVDCLCDMSGKLLSNTIRLRHKIKDGITNIGSIVQNKYIQKMAEDISNNLLLPGCWFFQVKEDVNKQPVLLEINSRVSGTMCLTRASGINLPLMTVYLFLNKTINYIPETIKDLTVIRYLSQEFIWEDSKNIKCITWDLDDTLLIGKYEKDKLQTVNKRALILANLINMSNIPQIIISKNIELTNCNNKKDILKEIGIPDIFEDIICDFNMNKSACIGKLLKDKRIDANELIHIDDSVLERKNITDNIERILTFELNSCFDLLFSLFVR